MCVCVFLFSPNKSHGHCNREALHCRRWFPPWPPYRNTRNRERIRTDKVLFSNHSLCVKCKKGRSALEIPRVSGNKLEYVNETMPLDERKDGLDQKRINQISMHTHMLTEHTKDWTHGRAEGDSDKIPNSWIQPYFRCRLKSTTRMLSLQACMKKPVCSKQVQAHIMFTTNKIVMWHSKSKQ